MKRGSRDNCCDTPLLECSATPFDREPRLRYLVELNQNDPYIWRNQVIEAYSMLGGDVRQEGILLVPTYCDRGRVALLNQKEKAGKRKTYTTITERIAFGKLFWPPKRAFQARGR